MKRIRLIAILIFGLTLLLSLNSCNFLQPVEDILSSIQNSADSESGISDDFSKEETLPASIEGKTESEYLNRLAYYLKSKNYAGILSLMKLPEYSVVCADDIKYAIIYNDILSGLVGRNTEISDVVINEQRHSAVFSHGSYKKEFIFRSTGENSEMRLSSFDSYWKQAAVLAPRNTEISINGYTLDESRWAALDEKVLDKKNVCYYLLVPKNPMIAHVKTAFMDDDTEVIWNDALSAYDLLCPPPKDTQEKILHEIKYALNGIFYEIDCGNETVENFTSYFSSDASAKAVLKIVSALKSGKTAYADIVFADIYTKDNHSIRVTSDTSVYVNFCWKTVFGSNYASDTGSAELHYENGKWKIVTCTLKNADHLADRNHLDNCNTQ